jgi:ribosomal protein L31E
LVAYTDSDYAGDEETKRSTSGVLIMRGGPVVWCTQKQSLVVNSTAEAEYRAAVSVIDDLCWIRRLANELNRLDISKPTTLFVDNRSAIHMLKNTYQGKITKGKKHIEISRKFIQQHIDKSIKVEHVKSEGQLADILTKPLSRNVFQRLRLKIIKEECCN